MSNMIKSMLFILLVGLISGCASPAPTNTSIPEPTLTPPKPTSPPASIADPAELVQGFWDAMNERDLDAAMALVADDVQCRGHCYLNSKESLRSFLQGRLDTEKVWEVNHLQVEGDTVNYLVDWYTKEGFLEHKDAKEMMRVQNGKIVYWEIE